MGWAVWFPFSPRGDNCQLQEKDMRSCQIFGRNYSVAMNLHRFILILTLVSSPVVFCPLSAQPNEVTPALLDETKAKAEKGDAEAQDKLGFYYGRGALVKQDYDESARWFRKAAEQGHAPGQLHLALAYAKNKGVPRDPQEALKWMRKSVDQAYAPALYAFGFWYASGQIVAMDVVEAHKWYSLALAQGETSAKAALSNLEKELSAEQIATAKERAAAFKPIKKP